MKIHTLLQIKGNNMWRSLNKKIVNNTMVDIKGCIDNHPPSGPLKFESEIVFFRECDGNQLYYHLNPKKFPNLKCVYIDSYYEPEVYNRFPQDVNIYITENILDGRPWQKIIDNRVNVGNRYIKVITKEDLNYRLTIANKLCE